MPLELYMISTSIALIAVSIILITIFSAINRSLAELNGMLREIKISVSPMASDIRTISRNAAAASESLRTGMEKINRMTDAVGAIGDDLEEGRRSVRGGMRVFGALVAPWLAKFKV